MRTSEKSSKWTIYKMSKRELIEMLSLAPDTDYISVYVDFMDKVEITTTRKSDK